MNGRAAAASWPPTRATTLRPTAVPAWARSRPPHASTRLDHLALALIQHNVRSAPIRFVLWDGYERPSLAGPAVGTIVFRNRPALLRWVWDPDLNFGEAYMSGAVEIEGDLLLVLEAIYRALGTSPKRAWRRAWQSNDARTSKHNVHLHYDLGNDFYRLWLDREMLYTCAYFPTEVATLEEAQIAKMDLVCRKLHLKSGDHVVEAGCGWGAFALYMARQYGATVRAFNISSEQIALARARAEQEGLGDRVEFIEGDYREVDGRCDVFVSLGMLEHVGARDFATLGNVIDRVLTDSGRGLLHFIGRDRPSELNPWIRKRIFPGAYPPALSEVFTQVLEPHEFSVLDVENLRLHYAETLKHWRQRFDDAADRIAPMFDDAFIRAWHLYLAGSEAAFTTGSMQLFQVVFARGGHNTLSRVRFSG